MGVSASVEERSALRPLRELGAGDKRPWRSPTLARGERNMASPGFFLSLDSTMLKEGMYRSVHVTY